MKKPTVAQIRDASEFGKTYFSRSTLRFFRQTMRGLCVSWNEERQAWETRATMYRRAECGDKLIPCGVSSRLWERDTLLPHKIY